MHGRQSEAKGLSFEAKEKRAIKKLSAIVLVRPHTGICRVSKKSRRKVKFFDKSKKLGQKEDPENSVLIKLLMYHV